MTTPTAFQASPRSLPQRLWDVLIVGAGPAGSVAAIHLASWGHQVLLFDKKRFPREKTCGDGLIRDALRCLHKVGLYQTVRKRGHLIRTASIFSPARLDVQIPGTYLTLRRSLLDSLLARKAVDSGAVFGLDAVEEIFSETRDSVVCAVSGRGRTYRARVGIIATGSNVRLSQKLGMVTHYKPSGVALRCYVRSSFVSDHFVFSYDRSILPAFAWIFPMGNDEYNMGCGIFYGRTAKEPHNLVQRFRAFTRKFPLARDIMRAGRPISPLRGGMLRCGLKGTRPLAASNILAVGEAIGTTLPLTGEGVGKAMESGELAATVIHEALASGDLGSLQTFPAKLEKELAPRYPGYRAAQRWVSMAWLNDFVVRRARESVYLQESLARVLEEKADPRQAFSVRGVMSSFWK